MSEAARMFVLWKIVEGEGLTADVLHANLRAPDGWMSLARLCCEGLVVVVGNEVIATEAGERFAHRMRQALATTTPSTPDAGE